MKVLLILTGWCLAFLLWNGPMIVQTLLIVSIVFFLYRLVIESNKAQNSENDQILN